MSNTDNLHIAGIAPPKHITSLATAGVLVHIDQPCWSGNVTDKAASDELAADKHADRKALSLSKALVKDCKEFVAVRAYKAVVASWLKAHTFEWAGNWHLLPVSKHAEFMKQAQVHEQVYQDLVDKFLNVYPGFVSNQAFSMQGQLFKREDYPDVADLRAKFGFAVNVMPVPLNDFRVSIADEAAEDLNNHYVQQTQKYIDNMARNAREDLTDLMGKIAHACRVEVTADANGQSKTVRGKIFDSVLDRALNLCDTLRDFSPIEDAALASARKDLADVLRGVNRDVLRDSDSVRVRVKNEVTDILKRFGA
jgi:hypothetical protein